MRTVSSERITILGMGELNPSRTYETLVFCIAGIGEVSGWVRLYPVFFDKLSLRVFDVITVRVIKTHPERNRPESRRIDSDFITLVSRINQYNARVSLLNSLAETGDFLHGEAWRTRSLGLTKPLAPKFWVADQNTLKVHWYCSTQECNGHTNQIFDIVQLERTGAGTPKKRTLMMRLLGDIKDLKFWFVMGTHHWHPHRWMLIAAHFTAE